MTHHATSRLCSLFPALVFMLGPRSHSRSLVHVLPLLLCSLLAVMSAARLIGACRRPCTSHFQWHRPVHRALAATYPSTHSRPLSTPSVIHGLAVRAHCPSDAYRTLPTRRRRCSISHTPYLPFSLTLSRSMPSDELIMIVWSLVVGCWLTVD